MKTKHRLLKWFLVGVVALLITAIALAGCGPEEVVPPEEEAVGGTGVPADEGTGGAGVPADEGTGGAGTPAGETAGETTPPSSPGAVSVDIELEVNSTNPEGVKFVAPQSGSYKITIVGGAFCYLPQDVKEWAMYGGWLTELNLYINRPVEWGAPDEWGQHPVNSDGTVGSEERYATFAEAEATGQGLSVTVDLDKDGYVIVLVSDGSDFYIDNIGTVKIRITGP